MSECVKVLRDELPYNLHIFVNSVEFIAKVIDTLKLAPEAVKVVCSTSGESRQENQRKLGNAYPIGQPSDPAKKVNFYTSTCFEGCDIFDPDGVTFIVSDGRKAHTLLDISTLFTQICGRIRDSRYKAQIVHVYSTTKYSKAVTLDEFVAATQRTLADAESYAAEINSLSEATRVKTLSKIPLKRILNDTGFLNFKNIFLLYRVPILFKARSLLYHTHTRFICCTLFARYLLCIHRIKRMCPDTNRLCFLRNLRNAKGYPPAKRFYMVVIHNFCCRNVLTSG